MALQIHQITTSNIALIKWSNKVIFCSFVFQRLPISGITNNIYSLNYIYLNLRTELTKEFLKQCSAQDI